MPANPNYLSSILGTFAAFLELQEVPEEIRESSTLLFIQFLEKKQAFDNWSEGELAAFLEKDPAARNFSPVPKQLVRQFVSDFPPYQTNVLLHQYLLALKEDGCSHSTVKNYRSDINQFLQFSNETDISRAVAKPKLIKFLRYQRQKGLKRSSVRRKLVSITQFSQWAENKGLLNAVTPWLNELSNALENIDQWDAGLEEAERLTPPEVPAASPRLLPLKSISNPGENATLKPTPANKRANSTAQDSQEFRTRLKHHLSALSTRVDNSTKSRLLPYLNAAMILLFAAGVSFFGYKQFIQNANSPLAYPAALTRPNRTLSFQGRLTDSSRNPITTSSNIRFKLYDSGPTASGGNMLWDSGVCAIDPDQDGIFSVGLGDECGSEIAENVFTENSNVWLQVEIDNGSSYEVLDPRQSIKTVPYAINAETLQGYPASPSAVESTVLVMDENGDVNLGSLNPELRASNGTFTIEAQSMVIQTTSGSNGDIVLTPDGTGEVAALSDLFVSGYLRAPGATLSATYAGGKALVVNGVTGQTANLTEWNDGDGNTTVIDEDGRLGIGTNNPSAALQIELGEARMKSQSGGYSLRHYRHDGPNLFNINNEGGLEGGIRGYVNINDNLSVVTGKWVSMGGGSLTFYGSGNNASIFHGARYDGSTYTRSFNNYLSKIGFQSSTSNTSMFWQSTDASTGTPNFVNRMRFFVDGTGSKGGQLAIGDGSVPTANLDINVQDSGTIGQIVKGASGQTANLFEIRNNAGTGLSAFDASGNLAVGSTTASYKLDVTGTGRFTGQLSADAALELNSTLLDVNESAGSAGQILSSTGTGVDWIDATTFTDTDDQTLAEVLAQGNSAGAYSIDMNGQLITNIGNVGTNFTSGGGLTVASTLTASNGLTLTTGALNLTATSGALSLSGLSASSISTGINALTFTSSNFNTTATGINGTAIGATTPSTGAFTTLSSTGATTLGNNTAGVTINSNTWDISAAGAASGLTGITSSGSITFSGLTANRFVKTTTGGQLTTAQYVDLTSDVTGTLPVANGGTNATTIGSAGSIAYSTGSAYAFTGVGSTNECLLSAGTGAPTWGSCAGAVADSIPWQVTDGRLYAKNSTVDMFVGGTATESAKFAVLNMNSGTPTASVSAGTAGAAYLTATGNLATTAMQQLTLGGSTTGAIQLKPNNTDGLYIDQTGEVGIGTTSPSAPLHIKGTQRYEHATLGTYTETTAMNYGTGGWQRFQLSGSGASSINGTTAAYEFRDSSNALLTLGSTSNESIFHYAMKVNGNTTLGSSSSNTLTLNAGAWTSANDTTWNLPTSTTALNIESDLFNLDTTNGRIGIGTNAPGAKLDVQGGIRIGAAGGADSILNIAAGSTATDDLYWGDKMVCDASEANCGFVTLASVTLQQAYIGGNEIQLSATEGDFRIYNDNSDEMLFADEDTGYLGVGTISPDVKLDVNGKLFIGNQDRFATYFSGTTSTFKIDDSLELSGSTSYTASANSHTDLSIDSATGNTFYGGLYTAYIDGLASTTAGVNGLYTQVDNDNTGTIGYMRGLLAIPKTLSGSGTVTTATGGQFGVWTQGGTITNARGVVISNLYTAGTITNKAGLIVEAMSGATNNTNLLLGTSTIPTGAYSIYSSSSSDSYLAGKLGIANASPTYELDVTGYGRFTQTLRVENVPTLTDNDVVLTRDASTNEVKQIDTADWDKDVTNDIGGTGTTGYLAKWSAIQTLTDSVIYDDGALVGIGTNTPGSKLSITNNGDTATGQPLVRLDQYENQNFLAAYYSGAGTPSFWVDSSGYVHSDKLIATTDSNYYLSPTGATSLTTVGRAGIGTATPSSDSMLHISAASAIDGTAPVTFTIGDTRTSSTWTADAAFGQINFNSADTSGAGATTRARIASVMESDGGAGGITGLAFSTANGTSGLTEKMRIANDGEVGIGVADPLARLHVNSASTTGVADLRLSGGSAIAAGKVAGLDLYHGTNLEGSWKLDASGSMQFQVEAGAGASANLDFNTSASNSTVRFWPKATKALELDSTWSRFYQELYVDGDVGLGTQSPDAKLHVYTDAAGTTPTLLKLDNQGTTTGTGSEILFENYNYSVADILATSNPGGSYAGTLQLRTRTSSNTWGSGLTLDSSSNLTVGGGTIYNNTSDYRWVAGSNWNYLYTPSGYIGFGPTNTSYAHIYTDRPSFYFNKELYANGGSLVWNAGNDGSGSGLDADTVDTLHASSFLRSDTNDTFAGKLSVNSTSNRAAGIYGIYDPYRIGHIWSMGTSFAIDANGANFGNLYGLAYKHTNNTTGGTMAAGHQMVWAQSGTPTAALGTNIWTSGDVIADGNDFYFGAGGRFSDSYSSNYTSVHPRNSALYVVGDVWANAGTAASPAFAFTADTNTGMYRSGTDTLNFATGGVSRVNIDSTGRTGIGRVASTDTLEVQGRVGIIGGSGKYIQFGTWDNLGTPYVEVRFNGSPYGISMYASRRDMKKNIADIEIDSSKIFDLQPKSFNWNIQEDGEQKDFGYIADEVEPIFPELMMYREDGEALGVRYQMLGVLNLIELKKLRLETNNFSFDKSGDLILAANHNNNYVVKESATGTLASRVGGFAELVAAKVRAGVVNTKELVVERRASIANLSVNSLTIEGQTLREYIASTVLQMSGSDTATSSGQLISPVAKLDNLEVEGESHLAGLLVTDDATFSGTLSAKSTLLGDLTAQTATIEGTLVAENIETETITAATISAHSTRLAMLESRMAEFEKVKADTAEFMDATISGTLYADTIMVRNKIASSEEAPSIIDIFKEKIASEESGSPSVQPIYDAVANSGFEASGSAELNLTLEDLELSESDVTLTAQALFIDNYFKVNGSAYIADSLGLGKQLLIGEGTRIADGSIGYTAPAGKEQIFEIQPSGRGTLSLMAGLVVINENGSVAINGSLNVAGNLEVEETLLANLIQPADFGNPFQVQVAGAETESGEVKKSRFEIINELGTPVATISAEGKADFAAGIGVGSEELSPSENSSEVDSSKSSGKALVPAGSNEITIKSRLIAGDSLIYVTPVGSTQNQVLYVKSQQADNPDTPENEGRFVVGFDTAVTEAVNFNWWIVN